MSIALVAHNITGSPDSSGVTSGALNTTGATLLIICLVQDTTDPQSVSDNKGNSWTALTGYNTNFRRMHFYYSIPTTVGSGHTATINNSGNSRFPAISFSAWSGTHATTPFDVENGFGSGVDVSTIQPGTVTPSEANELVITGVGHYSASTTPTADSGFSALDSILFNSGLSYGLSVDYIIETSIVAKNPTWTGSLIDTSNIATFKAAAVAASKSLIIDLQSPTRHLLVR